MKKSNAISIFTFLIVCVLFTILLAVPLWDIDLWWHLASGKHFFETKSITKNDPFCFTSEQGISPSRAFLINAYWLAQLLFYAAFTFFGYYGIIGLRVMIFVLIFLAIFLSCKKNNLPLGLTFLALVLCGWLSLYYTGERPQLFTLLFTTVLLLLFEAIGLAKKSPAGGLNYYEAKKAIWVPVIMLVWANMHPGFILGAVLIGMFIGSEMIKTLVLKYPVSRKSFYIIVAVMFSGIITSFINPNIYASYLGLLWRERSIIEQRVSEYLSPLVMLKEGLIVYPYWIYLLLSLLILICFIKKIDLTHIIITVFLLILSLRAHRYIPFFVFGTSFILIQYASDNVMERDSRKKLINIIGGLIIVVLIFFTVRGFNSSLGRSIKSPLNESRFPVKASEFIMQQKPQGNIFNHLDWGGYLEWKLFPSYKVFIDGRNLSLRAFRDYTYILWEQKEGGALLDAYKINLIIMPAINYFSGELYDLTNYLYADKNWVLVYRDEAAMIFLRKEDNKEVIETFSLPKTEIYTHVIDLVHSLQRTGMKNSHLWRALDRAYRVKGMYAEAERAAGMARRLEIGDRYH